MVGCLRDCTALEETDQVAVAGVPEVIIVLQIFQKDIVIKLIIPVVINTRCGIVHLLPPNIHDIDLHKNN